MLSSHEKLKVIIAEYLKDVKSVSAGATGDPPPDRYSSTGTWRSGVDVSKWKGDMWTAVYPDRPIKEEAKMSQNEEMKAATERLTGLIILFKDNLEASDLPSEFVLEVTQTFAEAMIARAFETDSDKIERITELMKYYNKDAK